MNRSYEEVTREIVEWVYTDTLVADLDESKINSALIVDTEGDSSRLPTKEEVELFVTGSPDEDDQYKALCVRFPKLDAYLSEQLS